MEKGVARKASVVSLGRNPAISVTSIRPITKLALISVCWPLHFQ